MNGKLGTLLAARGVAILDGGLATELAYRGYDLDDPLWSAALLLREPDAIAAVHTDYLEAGADIIIAASYQASYAGLAARGLDRDHADAIFDHAMDLARHARDTWLASTDQGTPTPLVAASIGPYGATLADGSEYTGEYGPVTEDALVEFHRPRLQRLAARADVLACETIPSRVEVAALARVLAEVLPSHPGLSAWISCSCRDDRHVAHGEPIEDALASALSVPGVEAVGINCTAPDRVEPLVRRVAAIAGELAIVAYPNAGETWNAAAHAWDGDATDPEAFCALARTWVEAGATIVGGCCRTGPSHIAALRRRLAPRLPRSRAT